MMLLQPCTLMEEEEELISVDRYRRGRDRMVVGYTTAYAISAYHHWSYDFESRSGEVYSIQKYVIKVVNELRLLGGFLLALRFPPPITKVPQQLTICMQISESNVILIVYSDVLSEVCYRF